MFEKEAYCKPTFNNIPEEKQKKILAVAVNEFATEGFDNANINTIAKKAQVSVGSLYKYFDTKTDLFLMSVRYGITELDSVIENIVASDADVMVKLEGLIRSYIAISRRSKVLIKLYNEVTSESNNQIVEKIAAEIEEKTCAAYRKTIEDGQRSGEIRKDIDPGIAAFLVDNILMNVQFSYACDYYSYRYKIYAGDDIMERDDFAINNILRFIKGALKGQKNKEI
ncbi:MAG: TetR/AcrR family transcriptional regulator [Clostridia bacterium]|nr:TetR/AcrR family transcriptional regulator [Clostridia bacterium]